MKNRQDNNNEALNDACKREKEGYLMHDIDLIRAATLLKGHAFWGGFDVVDKKALRIPEYQ